eukprot:scaffold372916_cov57-Attheya_sp.AAC.1
MSLFLLFNLHLVFEQAKQVVSCRVVHDWRARGSHTSYRGPPFPPTVAYVGPMVAYGMVVPVPRLVTLSIVRPSVRSVPPLKESARFRTVVPAHSYGTYPGMGREGRQTDRRWIEWSGGTRVSK